MTLRPTLLTVTRLAAALALASPLLADEPIATLAAPSRSLPVTAPHVLGSERPVDVVICLDTSGSMENLIDSVRSRLWDVVLEFARMEPTPTLRVGLVTYGSPAAGTRENGFVAVRLGLTNDLDAVNAALSALRTDGGEEMVGYALRAAVDQMEWAPSPEGLRLVFIAGNESADQGREEVDFRAVATKAGERDVLINAIFAGERTQAITEAWPEIATAGRGNFTAIDARAALSQIETPHDAALLKLNERLNSTYLPYGEQGQAGLANQVAQDLSASRLGVQSCSSRVVAKGTSLYTNAAWDLVDAALSEGFQWGALTDAELPESLRPLTRDQRAARVAALRAERETVQHGIETLAATREEWLKAKLAELDRTVGLDDAMLAAIRAQAAAKGFK